MKILFVCRGNVGRSQMAAAFFNKFASPRHSAESAGFAPKYAGKSLGELFPGSTSHHVVSAMRERGHDLSQNVRKQITPEMLERNDKIIVMTTKIEAPEDLQNNSKAEFWEDIADMKGESFELHQKGRDQIEIMVKELIARL
jgi:protein-tyrosine-phosphatase